LRLLAGDPGEVLHRAVEPPGILGSLSDAHIDDDLLQLRYPHRVLDPEPLLEGWGDFLPVPVF
jgi:hypothetical protein